MVTASHPTTTTLFPHFSVKNARDLAILDHIYLISVTFRYKRAIYNV